MRGCRRRSPRRGVSHDRRDRRARRRGQEHGRAAARRAARLPLPRHRRDVPRADVARAAARRSPLDDGDELGGARARASGRASTTAGACSSPAPTSPRRSAGRDRPLVPVVARHPQVREVMRERQRELAEQGDAVIEGRDIGTVVAPGRGGEGLPRRRPERARARAARPSGPTSAPTRSRPTCACATSSDAARMQPGRGRRARSTRPSSRSTTSSTGSRSSSRIAPARMNSVDVVWAVGRLTIGHARAAARRRCATTASSASRAGRRRARDQPLPLARSARLRRCSRRARSTSWRRSRRTRSPGSAS